jgi:error-prone DNA polymerase
VRLGLRMVKGLSNDHGARVATAAMDSPFTSVEDVWRRSAVPVAALEKLADADAFHSLGLDRRQALWRVRGLGDKPLPLFAAAEARENEPAVTLTPMSEGREVVEDYRAVQLSLRAHPLAFLRGELDRRGVTAAAGLKHIKDGGRVHVAGVVLVRQRPGAGNVTFLTLEDETGIANVIIWQRVFDRYRRIILSSPMVSVRGILQREGQVVHVITDRLEDYTDLFRQVGAMDFPHRFGPGDAPTRGGGRDPRDEPPRPRAEPQPVIQMKTRDFH